MALAPYDDPKYVVAVTIERGGFGADAAAPATQQILNELLKVNEAQDRRRQLRGRDLRVMEAFPHSRPRFDQPRASLLARAGFARLDPLVLVAGIGIVLFSIYTLGVATKDDFDGRPLPLRGPPGDLRRDRDRGDAGDRQGRLLALPRARVGIFTG